MDILTDHYVENKNHPCMIDTDIAQHKDIEQDRNYIFISDVLQFFNIKLDNTGTSKKSTYFYNEYVINCMYDDQYLYLKIKSNETMVKIVITKLMYSINFIKDENIVLATYGTIQDILNNPKISSDDEMYYTIIKKIYNHIYKHNNSFARTGFKQVENILGLYCFETDTEKIFKYIELDHKYNTDTDIHRSVFGNMSETNYFSDHFKKFSTTHENMFMASKLVNNLDVLQIIRSYKCYVNDFYLSVEIYDNGHIMSSYHIPLNNSDTSYYIEKQWNAVGDHCMTMISAFCFKEQWYIEEPEYHTMISGCKYRKYSYGINGYLRFMEKMNKKTDIDRSILMYRSHQYLHRTKIDIHYLNKIYYISQKIYSVIQNDMPALFDILLGRSVSYDTFHRNITSDQRILWTFGFLFEFLHNDKLLFACEVIDKYVIYDKYCFSLEELILNYNKFFNRNLKISELEKKVDPYLRVYTTKEPCVISEHRDECVPIPHSDEITEMFKEVAEYFINQ